MEDIGGPSSWSYTPLFANPFAEISSAGAGAAPAGAGAAPAGAGAGAAAAGAGPEEDASLEVASSRLAPSPFTPSIKKLSAKCTVFFDFFFRLNVSVNIVTIGSGIV